jgi:hypothetical protein
MGERREEVLDAATYDPYPARFTIAAAETTSTVTTRSGFLAEDAAGNREDAKDRRLRGRGIPATREPAQISFLADPAGRPFKLSLQRRQKKHEHRIAARPDRGSSTHVAAHGALSVHPL